MTTGTPPQWVLPEPAWTLSDYATQCQNDPEHTAGALILYDIENDAGTYSWILYQTAYAHLYAKSVLIDCAKFTIDNISAKITAFSTSTIQNSGPQNQPPQTATLTNQETKTKTRQRALSPPQTANAPSKSGPSQSDKVTKTYIDTKTNQSVTATSSPPPEVITRTATDTAVPQMRIVWQNSDNLSGRGRQGAVPFLGLAALGAYLAQRFTKSVTTTKTEAAPSSVTIGKTVTNTTTTVTNASDLPLGLAVISSSVSSLNSASFGGTNQTRILKSASAGLATRLINLLSDDCYPAGKCSEIDNMKIFNLDQFHQVERARP